jgi:hypothetical protein
LQTLVDLCYNDGVFENEMSIDMKKSLIILLVGGVSVLLIVGGYLLVRAYFSPSSRSRKVFAFLRNPDLNQARVLQDHTTCGDAPFMMPTSGMVGFIWDDSFRPGHRHQGIDIFSGKDVGETPIFAAYEGYLTRMPDWISTVIIRIPSDPLNPGQQIWTYYTHMADSSGKSLINPDFPPGTAEVFVPAGTLLGSMGNYSGTPGNPTGVHLHFSIVKDSGRGIFLNELEIQNTLDPSPYFGMSLNANENPDRIPVCEQN